MGDSLRPEGIHVQRNGNRRRRLAAPWWLVGLTRGEEGEAKPRKTPLFSERLKRKDFQEVARLAWAQAARLQQLLPSLLTANASNKSGNLKDNPAAECLRCCVKQGTKYALVAGKNVYTLEGHEVELDKYVTQKVTVKGTLKGETLTVESVHPAK